MKTQTRKIVFRTLAATLLVAVVAICAVVYIARSGAVKNPGSLYLPQGTDYAALMDSLRSGDRIRFEGVFGAYSRRIGLTRKVKPGHYRLEKGMSVIRVARMLNLGEQTPVNVVLRPFRLPSELAQSLSKQLETDSVSFRKAMNDPEQLKKYGFDTELELFSIFIPNTYEVWWTATPEEFLSRMKREYDSFWNDERTKKLPRTGLDKMEAITLASIICEETQKPEDLPVMAGVYLNRLRLGMALQACPTAKYAVGDFTLRRILNKHTQFPSPYNTYINKGLPPTPICMPPIAAIDAVLDYKDHDYLFFCAREDFSGFHNYATTYAEHLENGRRYAAALDKRGIF